MKRYTGHSPAGHIIFMCDTAQQAGDAAAKQIERAAQHGRTIRPLGYTYDNKPGIVRPYTVWRRDETTRATVCESFATFADVCAAWGKA